jgi:hypothetical protein
MIDEFFDDKEVCSEYADTLDPCEGCGRQPGPWRAIDHEGNGIGPWFIARPHSAGCPVEQAYEAIGEFVGTVTRVERHGHEAT